MRLAMRAIALGLGLLASAANTAAGHPLERGLVVSDPMALDLLDKGKYGFRELIRPLLKISEPCGKTGKTGVISTNPFEHQPLCDVTKTIQDAIKAAQASTHDRIAQAYAREAIFPIDFFTDNDATLTLTGIVNRIDRAYRSLGNEALKDTCGEVRFIYRFGYTERYPIKLAGGAIQDKLVSSRLPLTLNLVLKARPTIHANAAPGSARSCAGLADRWLKFGNLKLGQNRPGAFDAFVTTPADAQTIARALIDAKSGPIAGLAITDIDRIEVNMQTMRLTASSKEDFGTHAEYLLKVFRWDTFKFVVQPLENQIDANLGANRTTDEGKETFRKNLRDLISILTDDRQLLALDRGELVLADRFLSKSAVSVAPGGASRSQNRPFDKLVGSDDDCKATSPNRPYVVCAEDIQSALERNMTRLRTIKSFDGFVTRLNDMSCSGCHQMRGVAGFHFTGADLPNVFSANAVFVPGSPHFFGDLPRRRQILETIARGDDLSDVDFSRGFSARPEERFRPAFAGTQLLDGWGATCSTDAAEKDGDPSFADWKCADGLACEVVMEAARAPNRGICTTAPGPDRPLRRIGDPLERGRVFTLPANTTFELEKSDKGKKYTVTLKDEKGTTDVYARTKPNEVPAYRLLNTGLESELDAFNLGARPAGGPFAVAQQLFWAARTSGGFPGGNLRTECCIGLPEEATCGKVAIDGFNDCLAKSQPTEKSGGTSAHTIDHCFNEYTNYAGLRACDAATPCRDDYICLRPLLKPGSVDAEFAKLKALKGKNADDVKYQYSCEKPDTSWKQRAAKGTCLPPYFVMQFRADKHHAMPDAQSGK